ncbi:MAG: hypothetical protein WKF52_11125 [Sphingomicrobium sp.]
MNISRKPGTKDFEASAPTASALAPQMAFNAGRVLQCATADATSRLRPQTMKLYVGSCVQFAELFPSGDVEVALPALRQVIDAAPRFEPAWKKLLLGEAIVAAAAGGADGSAQAVRTHIRAARSAKLALAEAHLAEAELLPPVDFSGRLRLVDRAGEIDPENPFVLFARSVVLMNVGRLNEAVRDAEKASRIDPLSTSMRVSYILTMAYSGRIPRAFQELRQAEQLSPDVANLIDARFRLNLRYGDPREALRILRQHGTSQQLDAFLLARIEPTPANIEKAIGIARSSTAQSSTFSSLIQAMAAFGRNDEIFDFLMRWPNPAASAADIQVVFRPDLKPLRAEPKNGAILAPDKYKARAKLFPRRRS